MNKRQREFKKLMKEAEKKQTERQSVYSYWDQRFSHEKPKGRTKRPLLQIGGFLGLLVLIWNLYALSTHVIQGGSGFGAPSAKYLVVHEYIQSGSEAEQEISIILNSLIDMYNNNSLTPFHIEESQQKLFALQKTLPLDKERFAAMNRYLQECFSLAFQVTNVLNLENAPTANQELTYIIGRQTELSASREHILVELLESEKINYKFLSDGSLSYEY
ncbi:hypothetical protein [Planococcus sp. CAU13]|uniref:hypothetical protein n=1 Tax=Planococcus sp. CAU13 TaxID=1541197 RepID=UPI00052FFF81|nr:hypothetical protein [Planococcus sp. CAU13]